MLSVEPHLFSYKKKSLVQKKKKKAAACRIVCNISHVENTKLSSTGFIKMLLFCFRHKALCPSAMRVDEGYNDL